MNQNLIQDQKQSLSVETVRNAHLRLIVARENFRQQYGTYPPIMHVGQKLFESAFPVRHDFGRYPAQAIESTLIVPREICGDWGLAIPKLPELKNAKSETAA